MCGGHAGAVERDDQQCESPAPSRKRHSPSRSAGRVTHAKNWPPKPLLLLASCHTLACRQDLHTMQLACAQAKVAELPFDTQACADVMAQDLPVLSLSRSTSPVAEPAGESGSAALPVPAAAPHVRDQMQIRTKHERPSRMFHADRQPAQTRLVKFSEPCCCRRGQEAQGQNDKGSAHAAHACARQARRQAKGRGAGSGRPGATAALARGGPGGDHSSTLRRQQALNRGMPEGAQPGNVLIVSFLSIRRTCQGRVAVVSVRLSQRARAIMPRRQRRRHQSIRW